MLVNLSQTCCSLAKRTRARLLLVVVRHTGMSRLVVVTFRWNVAEEARRITAQEARVPSHQLFYSRGKRTGTPCSRPLDFLLFNGPERFMRSPVMSLDESSDLPARRNRVGPSL